MDYLKDYLPWIMSVITIYMTVLAGNKSRFAWAVGLSNQALWLIWIISMSAWGLLPMNIALWIIYFRNHLRWNQKEEASADQKEWQPWGDNIPLEPYNGSVQFSAQGTDPDDDSYEPETWIHLTTEDGYPMVLKVAHFLDDKGDVTDAREDAAHIIGQSPDGCWFELDLKKLSWHRRDIH